MTTLEQKNISLGLVGAGYWGKNLVRVFNTLGVLKKVCDCNTEVISQVKKDYPEISVVQDFNNLLEDRELVGIVIASPAVSHYELAKKALIAGKHVFVEKPLALKVQHGEELVALAKDKELVLMVGHLLLYHPAIVKLKEMIKSGDLGEIRYIYSNRLNFGKLRTEENVLWSFAPHDIAIVLDFLGMPKSVNCLGKDFLQKNIPDVTLTFLEFDNNQAAHIFVSWLNPFKEQKLSIIGSLKMAVFDGVLNQLSVFEHKVQTNGSNFIQAMPGQAQAIDFGNEEPLMQEAKHFLESIQENKTPLSDGKEALAVLRVLEGSQKSLEEGTKIVL
ncbi:MAG: Gfo/Idh/MocA family oxidoreductase [bacterium]